MTLGMTILVGLLISVILFLIVLLSNEYSRKKEGGREDDHLKYEIDTLRETVGSLQALLGSKDRELDDTRRKLDEKQALLDQESENNRKILSMKKSSEVRTGHIAEHLAPLLMEQFNSRNLRHLGQPIDYIAFENDGIYFVEVKSGRSHLSHNQKKVRQLVQQGKVYWSVFRLKGKGTKSKSSKK